jgi:S-DNA-T family DNA segregation ATPase FtsK/SpoIIIE
MLAIALWGHDFRDPSLNFSSDGPSGNLLGRFGASLADLGLQTLGLAVWVVVLVLPIWGLRLVLNRPLSWAWLAVAALPPALIAQAVFLATLELPPRESWPYLVGLGGVIGDFALHRFEPVFSPGGYALYSLLAALVLSVVALGLTIRDLWAVVTGLIGFATGLGRQRQTPARRPRAGAAGRDAEPGGLGSRLGALAGTTLGFLGGLLLAPFRRLLQRESAPARRPLVRHPPLTGGALPAEAAAPAARRGKQPPADDEEDFGAPQPRTGRPAPIPQSEPPELEPDDNFELPPLKFLALPKRRDRIKIDEAEAAETAKALEKVLDDFGVRGEIVAVKPGPVITLYELEPAPGTRAARVISLADDIARSLCAMSVRVATVPGRNVIGIELPNDQRETVYLSDLLSSQTYEQTSSGLGLALGKDISGEPVIVDLARMPHLLIAGTTGSGKSVAINAMILSLLYRMPPSACKLIMIDPKVIELSVYEGIPHLLAPVVTEPHKAVVALKWIVREMDDRYRLMSHLGVRDIFAYNRRISEAINRGEQLSRKVQTGFEPGTGVPIFEQQPIRMETLPLIVVIVDEVADLMLTAGKEIENAIQRLSQKARAAGIHLIVATQRPSVDVLTGVIKANLPARISFRVSSKIDSRTILGEPGAEQLLGQGDMLQLMPGERTIRIHGPLVTDEEVERVVTYLKGQGSPTYVDAVTNEAALDSTDAEAASGSNLEITNGEDAQYSQALQIVAKEGRASTSFLQRKLRIGYNSAARLIERMEQDGYVSQPDHVGRRKVLMGGGDEDGPGGVDAPW